MSGAPSRLRAGLLGVLVLLAGLLGWSELDAAGELRPDGDTPVDADVAPALAALTDVLVELEAACAEAADAALARAGAATDQADLFAALADLPLPPGAGVRLEDAEGRLLAWSGATLPSEAQTTAARAGAATSRIAGPDGSRYLAVRRDGGDRVVVCHAPIEARYVLRSRLLEEWSLEDATAEAFRVGTSRILPADAAAGEPVVGIDGEIARLDVKPLSARSWNEATRTRHRHRRAPLVAAIVLVAGLLLWHATGRFGRRYEARALLVLLARVALAWTPPATLLGEGPLTSPRSYAGALPLSLGDSPVALLLTCVALVGAAICLARAATMREPRLSAVPGAAVCAAVALAARAGLAWIVTDVVENSSVELFPTARVLPGAAATLLLAALIGAALAAVVLVAAACRAVRPLERGPTLAVTLALGTLLAPLGPGAAPLGAALAPLAIGGMWAALWAALAAPGTPLRAAIAPIGVAIALFAPLERHLTLELRQDVEAAADERALASHEDDPYALQRLIVQDVLAEVAASPLLADGIRSAATTGDLPRGLARELWSASALADESGGSSIEILPLEGAGRRQPFGAGLPPTAWLPDPNRFLAPDTAWTLVLAGREPADDGAWVVGETPVLVDGRRAASVRVMLSARPPAIARNPQLEILAPGRADERTLPPLAFSRYDAGGALLRTTAPRVARSRLPGAVRDDLDRGSATWFTDDAGDTRRLAYARPVEGDDGADARGALVASFDGGGTFPRVLRGTKAALLGALLALVPLIATAPGWVPRVQVRLAHRLVLSYVLVSVVPLGLLAWASWGMVRSRARALAEAELREAVALVTTVLEENRIPGRLLERQEQAARAGRPAPRGDMLRSVAYSLGKHASVFLGEGMELVESSDQRLVELLPARLPREVMEQVVLGGRPFLLAAGGGGADAVDVGWAPLRNRSQEVIGAVSVLLLHRPYFGPREQADALTAVLGVFLASLVAAVAAGSWLASRIAAPLRSLRVATSRVARGELSDPVPPAPTVELGEVVDAFNRMMTDLAESRARLVQAEKEAAWRDMARQVAHEVKNPLTPMRLAAEHLRRARREGAPDFDRILERAVDVIVRQTESLQRISTDFADFARLPVRRRDPVDLGGLVTDVLALYDGIAGLVIETVIETANETDVEDGIPPVLCDRDELRRVLVNLAGNAVEAFDGSDGTLRATLSSTDGWVVLALADDGPGIPEDALPHLFEPAFSTKTRGTGLGLAICKRAVEELGGTIGIESGAGAGTTVTIRLPAGEPGAL